MAGDESNERQAGVEVRRTIERDDLWVHTEEWRGSTLVVSASMARCRLLNVETGYSWEELRSVFLDDCLRLKSTCSRALERDGGR